MEKIEVNISKTENDVNVAAPSFDVSQATPEQVSLRFSTLQVTILPHLGLAPISVMPNKPGKLYLLRFK